MEDAWDTLPKYQEAKIYVSRPPSWFRRHLVHILYISFAILSNLLTVEVISNLYGAGLVNRLTIGARPTLSKAIFYSEIDPSYHEETLTGFLLNGTKYTAPASPQVDAAWDDLGVTYEVFLVPEELGGEFHAQGRDIVVPADTPGNRWGAGYPANMEALHQLHCVNLLRKALFFNYDYYASRASTFSKEDTQQPGFHHEPSAAFTDPPIGVRGHVNHCIDALRERIMCAADTGVSFYQWDEFSGHLMPDFARPRQCRNFESVRKFVEQRQLKVGGSSLKFNYTMY